VLSIPKATRRIPTLVLASSLATVFDYRKEVTPGPDGDPYVVDDWNPMTYEEGAESRDDPLVVYRTGRKYFESEAWTAADLTSRCSWRLKL
jgi:hypothetical protein